MEKINKKVEKANKIKEEKEEVLEKRAALQKQI